MKGARNGVALVQALVIVAALALVSLALLRRGETARLRLDDRFAADQAGLYLDSGVDLVRATLPEDVVHLRQDWAMPVSYTHLTLPTSDLV